MIRYVIKLKKGETLSTEQIDNIVKLKKLDIEREKAYLEHDAEVKKAKAENVKTGIGFVGTLAGLGLSALTFAQTLIFEETGTFTSTPGKVGTRELVSRLFKKQ